MDTSKWNSQIRKGLLEFGLLQLIRARGSVYGLEILEELGDVGLPLTEGTLYPLMSRLTREKIVSPHWETNHSTGHPRKYYSLTSEGELKLQAMEQVWVKMVESIEQLRLIPESHYSRRKPEVVS